MVTEEISVPKTKKLISIPELAEMYGLGKSALYKSAHEGTLAGALRFRTSWKVNLEVFDAWAKSGGLD